MTHIAFNDFIHKVCVVEFYFSREPERVMSYTGLIEAVIRDGEQDDHIVLNAHYAGRIQLGLETIKSIEETADY